MWNSASYSAGLPLKLSGTGLRVISRSGAAWFFQYSQRSMRQTSGLQRSPLPSRTVVLQYGCVAVLKERFWEIAC